MGFFWTACPLKGHLNVMSVQGFASKAEQVAQVLRVGLCRGRWRGTIPGRIRLAAELGVNHKTVTAALRLLEGEGMLEARGPGRERRIVLEQWGGGRTLRIGILLFEQSDRKRDYLLELLHRLRHEGHEAFFALKTMHDLGMNADRIARYAESEAVDAWVVVSGPRDLLERFASQPIPTFAMFGRASEVPIASAAPERRDIYIEMVERLVKLGHRRVVVLVRTDRRKPSPGWAEQFILEHLGKQGIPTGPYNLPDWEDTPEGLQHLLDSLFRHTPPTALILDEPALFFATRDHLARKGFWAPDHVSLVCCDSDPVFDWCRPAITHIDWDSRQLVNQVIRWTNRLAQGMDDRRKSSTKAWLVPGGTIGPAPRVTR